MGILLGFAKRLPLSSFFKKRFQKPEGLFSGQGSALTGTDNGAVRLKRL